VFFSVWALQKRSQCVWQRKKRHVLRWEKWENRQPKRTVERAARGSPFHREVPTNGKDLSWEFDMGNKEVNPIRGSKRTKGSGRDGTTNDVRKILQCKTRLSFKDKNEKLNCIRSEWSFSALNVAMWENRRTRAISLAAALSTDCKIASRCQMSSSEAKHARVCYWGGLIGDNFNSPNRNRNLKISKALLKS